MLRLVGALPLVRGLTFPRKAADTAMVRFLAFALLFVITVIVAMALSQVLPLERLRLGAPTVIAASPAEIHAVVSDLTTWKEWTIWNDEIDPTVEYTYLGEPGQVGQSMTWVGDELGEGTMTIESVSEERVTYTLEFAGMAPANVEFELTVEGEGTAVRWAMSGEMGSRWRAGSPSSWTP